ncbi:major facilitator superfamily protein, partial [Kipferlia bialata]
SFFLFELPSSTAVYLKDHFSITAAQYSLTHTVVAFMGIFCPSLLGLLTVRFRLGPVFIGATVCVCLSQLLQWVSADMADANYPLYLLARALFGTVIDVMFSFSETLILTGFTGPAQAVAYSVVVFVCRMASCLSYTLIPGVATDLGLVGTLRVTLTVSMLILPLVVTALMVMDREGEGEREGEEEKNGKSEVDGREGDREGKRSVSDVDAKESRQDILDPSGNPLKHEVFPVSTVPDEMQSDVTVHGTLVPEHCEDREESVRSINENDKPATDSEAVETVERDRRDSDTLEKGLSRTDAPIKEVENGAVPILSAWDTLLHTDRWAWLLIILIGVSYTPLYLFTGFYPLYMADQCGYTAEEASQSLYLVFLVNGIACMAVLILVSR